MGTITTTDGTQIYFKDWGAGQPVVFSHGWPLSGDAWDDQMLFLAGQGYRCIAHDRRGHGRSSQPWSGNDMDTYADDLAALVRALDLRDAVHVGHSTGGGEVARYIGRHGTGRVAWGAALIALAGAIGAGVAMRPVPDTSAAIDPALPSTAAGTPAPPRLAPLPASPAFPAADAALRERMHRAAAVTHAADRDGIAARLDVLVAAATRAAAANRPAVEQTQGLAWATEPQHLRAIDAPERMNGDFARYYADWTRFPDPAREIRELAEATFRRARLATALRQLDTAFALAPDDPATLVQYTRYALQNRQTDLADVISLMGLGRSDTTQFRGALWLLRGALGALANQPAQDVLGALWLAQAYFGEPQTYCELLQRLVETHGAPLRQPVDEVLLRLQSIRESPPVACQRQSAAKV